MAEFRFRFERLLEHRRRVERDRQLVVAALERERIALEDGVRRAQRSIESCRADLRGALAGEGAARGVGLLDVRAVRLQAASSLHLTVQTQRLALQLAGVHRRLAGARAELLEAARRRKAVEMLRQRELERWRREQARREAALLDEMATMRAARAGSDGAPTLAMEARS